MSKRILICDDDSDILAICQFILEEIGLEVHTRNNCNNIISVVSEVKPDVILMDNWIPDTGGIIATRMIKQHPQFKNIPVIYFSANTDIKLLAHEAGADSYLAKPFDINDLEKAISLAVV
ncbi:MAG: response regulator [Flavobacterium sp.]|nr:response regulator [Pedobacter sp.]